MAFLFGSLLLDIGLIIATVITLLYVYFTWTYDFWEKRGVPFLKPVPLFGNMKGIALRQMSFSDWVNQMYQDLHPHKLAGYFSGRQPTLLVRDPELLKGILVKDFDHFMDRRQFADPDNDVLLGRTLNNLSGQSWRDMRATLSPAFTSGKLKKMLHLICECGDQLVRFFEDAARNGEMVEMKDCLSRFSNDVIATTAFGVQCNSLSDPDCEFLKMAKALINSGASRNFLIMVMMFFPKLAAKLGITFMQEEVTNFFRTLVGDTMRIREEKNIVRPDMIHLMMLAKKGQLTEDDNEEESENDSKGGRKKDMSKILDDDTITAQAVIFFIAGYETVSTALSFTTYELAVNPDVQERLVKEIQSTLKEYDGQITYEGISKMTYLDMVISETIRKFPPAAATDRKCVKKYTFPGTSVTMDPGTTILIPIQGFHHDPNYFPNPEKFDPERFSPENLDKIVPYTYMPFGIGPRNCIGMRMALLELKIGLVSMLSKYELQVCEKTQIPLKLAKTATQNTGEKGIWLKLKNRK